MVVSVCSLLTGYVAQIANDWLDSIISTSADMKETRWTTMAKGEIQHV